MFVVEHGRARFVPVQKGIMGELEVEIASGLTESQTIIPGPYDALRTPQGRGLDQDGRSEGKTER